MKKDVLKLLSFTLCFIILLAAVPITFAAADNGLTLNVKLNRDEYIVGETALAQIYLTDAKDEIESGMTLGGIGTNLSFSNNLSFDQYGTVFNDAISDCKVDGDNVEIVPNSYNGKNILNVIITLENGVLLSDLCAEEEFTDETEINIASIKFTVGGSAGEQIKLKFEDDSLNDGSFPYITDIFDNALNKYDYTIQSAPLVNIVAGGAIVRDGNVYYSGNDFFAQPEVFVSRTEGAVLLAKLSYADGTLVAPVVIRNLSAGINSIGSTIDEEKIQFNYSGSKENLKITYYIWDSLTGMRCIAAAPVFDAVEDN